MTQLVLLLGVYTYLRVRPLPSLPGTVCVARYVVARGGLIASSAAKTTTD